MISRFNAIKAHIFMTKVFPHKGRAYEWLKRTTGKNHIHDLTGKELGVVTKELERRYRKILRGEQIL